MTTTELGAELKRAYETALRGEQALAVHLFGIRYSREIGSSSRAVVAASGIKATYATEVAKGVKLAKYVVLRSS